MPNAGNVSAVITALSKIPDLQIQNIQPVLSAQETASLNNQALKLALVNATAQAQLLAGSGVQLTIENITVQNQYFYGLPYAAGVVSAGPNAPIVTGINTTYFSGQVFVSKSVYVVFGKT